MSHLWFSETGPSLELPTRVMFSLLFISCYLRYISWLHRNQISSKLSTCGLSVNFFFYPSRFLHISINASGSLFHSHNLVYSQEMQAAVFIDLNQTTREITILPWNYIQLSVHLTFFLFFFYNQKNSPSCVILAANCAKWKLRNQERKWKCFHISACMEYPWLLHSHLHPHHSGRTSVIKVILWGQSPGTKAQNSPAPSHQLVPQHTHPFLSQGMI